MKSSSLLDVPALERRGERCPPWVMPRFFTAALDDVNMLDLLIPDPDSFYVMAPSAT